MLGGGGREQQKNTVSVLCQNENQTTHILTSTYLKYKLYLNKEFPFKSKTKAEQESWPNI